MSLNDMDPEGTVTGEPSRKSLYESEELPTEELLAGPRPEPTEASPRPSPATKAMIDRWEKVSRGDRILVQQWQETVTEVDLDPAFMEELAKLPLLPIPPSLNPMTLHREESMNSHSYPHQQAMKRAQKEEDAKKTHPTFYWWELAAFAGIALLLGIVGGQAIG